MKQGMKNIFPTFLSLVNLLAFEVLNNVDAIKQNQKIDLQTIGNTLILILSTYSIWRIIVEIKQTQKHQVVHYLNNFLIIASAFLLNIYIFKNEIVKISNIFNGWHAWWSIWFTILFLWFTGIGKSTFEMFIKIGKSIGNGARCLKGWASNAIKNIHKGVISAIISGLVLWFVFLGFIHAGKSDVSVEMICRESLIFWCGWFIICMLISFFANFHSQIGQVMKDKKNTNVIKVFLWTIIGAVILLVIMQVFPTLFPVIGSMLLFPLIIIVLVTIVFYTERENLIKIFKMKWIDLAVVCVVVIGVTFILLPSMGAASEEGQSILASNNIEAFKTFMELIIAGIEIVKEFL